MTAWSCIYENCQRIGRNKLHIVRVFEKLLSQNTVSLLWFKIAVSSAVLSMVRVLTIMHIVVGALLIIFGVADGGTAFLGREICLQLVTGSMGLDWCMGKCSLSKFRFR